MRRTLAAVAAAAVVLPLVVVGAVPARAAAVASPAVAGPGDVAPLASDARARRSELLGRIAALTDELDDTQARVVAAQFEQARVDELLSGVRERVRARAVAAYVHGLSAPDQMAAPTVYLKVIAHNERDLLARYRDARGQAAAQRDSAESAQYALRTKAVELDRARGALDRLVAADDTRLAAARLEADEAAAQAAAVAARQRATSEAARAAAEARARVGLGADGRGPLGRGRADGADGADGGGGSGAAGGDPGLVPRHVEATRKQAALMARYPFGVLAPGPLPAGLRQTGVHEAGIASWYGGEFNGRPTASGAIYDQEGWTAASRTLPLGTMIVVSRDGVRVLLLVNDRGPYVDGRIIDLSAAGARALDVGVGEVSIEAVAPPS
jgi:rare lipoprotein A (peptidoglycan hydrolase)